MSQKTSHGKLRSVSGFLLPIPEPMLSCHHCGEVDHRHAAEMAAVCNRWWGCVVKLLPVTSRECFCREAWSQGEDQAGHVDHDSRAHGQLLAAAFPWLKTLVAEKWPSASARLGQRVLCSEPHWQEINVSIPWNLLDTKQINDRHHGCTPPWRRISGGVALTAVCLQAVFLWMPEHKLYGIFLLAMKDRPFD